MAAHAFLLFSATAIFFSLMPGPAVLLVSAHGFRGGMKAALGANLGVMTGNSVYMLVSALGLTALIAASALAFTLIKAAGAAYLIYLGGRTFLRAGKDRDDTRPTSSPFAQGLLTQLGNPKAVLFFGAFLPQFLDAARPMPLQYAQMFAVMVVVESSALAFYGWLAVQGARLGGTALWRERISGVILIAVGLLFAATQRP